MRRPAKRFTAAIIAVAMACSSGYSRQNWRHWTDADGDCQDTRQEVLIRDSLVVPEMDNDNCRVKKGLWKCPYSGEYFTDPGDLDIDHMVPLKEAAESGGKRWAQWRKEYYANDLDYIGHLVAVDKSLNRSKGAKGPEHWKPPDKMSWCWYAVSWITVKSKYELSAGVTERLHLGAMLQTCAWVPA